MKSFLREYILHQPTGLDTTTEASKQLIRDSKQPTALSFRLYEDTLRQNFLRNAPAPGLAEARAQRTAEQGRPEAPGGRCFARGSTPGKA